MKSRSVRQTADLVLEAIDINAPRLLNAYELKRATGRSKPSVMDAIGLLKKERRIETEFDDYGMRRYRKSAFPAEMGRAA